MKRTELKEEAKMQLVVFRLGKEEFAVEILQVQEIILLAPITRVPKAPAFLVGMIGDQAPQPLSLPVSQIQPPPPLAGGVDAAYLKGAGEVDGRLIVILNLERSLSPQEMQAIGEMEVS